MINAITAIAIAKKIKDQYELSISFKILGFIYEKKKILDSAEYFFKQSIKIRIGTKDYHQITNDYIDLGNFYLNIYKDYTNAHQCYNKLYYMQIKLNYYYRSQSKTCFGKS